MKILLDECVTKRLKPHLPLHEVATVTEKGWSGLKNGQLMIAASAERFDILLTIDKNHQNSFRWCKKGFFVQHPGYLPVTIVFPG